LKENFINKSFLTLKDFSKEEILYLIDLAIKLKKERQKNKFKYRLKNKSIALIFEKTSTRTRCATSIACFEEGGHAEFLGLSDIQMGKKESTEDTARVLGRMFDAIFFRGYKQETVEKLNNLSGVPVINGLTDEDHPTQVLADFMTIKEVFGRLNNINLTYIGDGANNMAYALLIGAVKIGMNITIACPKKYSPDNEIINYVMQINKENSKINIIEDPILAVKDADVVYTDVWVSMGQEDDPEVKEKLQILKPYQVNKKLMSATNKETSIFLHCLPASHEEGVHNVEVTDDIFESDKSYVFDEAENRLHTIKAILVAILGDK
jgi:ornithine carbamoyltransferase